MRAAALLRNAANAAGKPKPMSADPTKYHLEPTGFWKKFRDVMVVNPLISSGLPLPDKNRYPPPGSRTEIYSTPATAASDIAFNQYYERDTRRAYPRTSVVTQNELSELLLAAPAVQGIAAPAAEGTDVAKAEVPALSVVLEKLPAGRAFVGGGLETAAKEGLPPAAPAFRPQGKWVPKAGEYIPRPPHAYFPIEGYN